MKQWSTLHAQVLPWVIGCPIPTVDAALVRAARKFCEGARVWSEDTEVTASGTTDVFDFDTPAGSEIVRVLSVKVGPDDYDNKVFDGLPSSWPEEAAPDGLYMHGDQFVLSPMPAAGVQITVKCAVKPRLSATSAGDVLFDSYGEDVAAGALAELLKMQQAWANPALSMDYSRIFADAINRAANRDFAISAPATHRVTIVD